ncbi:MAG: hypothetical protein ACREFP_22555 [Acetobacteraceae bacterium]
MAAGRRDNPKPEQLRFADGFTPPLVAGKHAITATQTLTLASKMPPFAASRTVHVSAPRFALAPGEIYSVYPPEGQSGAFATTLPHAVFTRKTLPWEREIGGLASAEDPIRPPWMALLTLDEDEIAQYPVLLSSVPVDELRNARKSAGLPELAVEPGEPADPKKNQSRVAEMPTERFREIAPALDELRFLAHARQVGTEDKDVADMLAEGWFAVVIGNRLPAQGKRNHGLLVSLEGLAKILRKKREEPAALAGLPATIRLPVLKHWQYGCAGPTFRALLEALTASRDDRKAGDVWLRISPSGTATADETVRKALALGYTALGHATRQGGKTVSWYRGPLIPLRLDVGPFPEIHANADEALHYDDKTGLFDVSYAAAWQLGRLLALQKADFADSLLHSRRGLVSEGVLRESDAMLRKANGDAGAIDSQKAKLLLQDDLMVAILTEWWLTAQAKADGNGGG